MPLPFLLALILQTTPDAAAAQHAPAATSAAADTSDIPSSAPTDDYGFVSWCRGALSGHMQLYPSVKDELRKVEDEKAAKEDAKYTTDAQREAATKRRAKEAVADAKLDQEQLEAGQTYLKLYTEAIEAAEAASASNLHARGEAARDAGFRIWAAARGAEPRTRMWSWVMWELPARCETAARRLKDSSLLLGGALKARTEAKADVPAASTTAPAGDTALERAATAAAARSSNAKADETVAPDAAAKVEPEAIPAAADAKVAETKAADASAAEAKPDESKAADAKPEDAKADEAPPALRGELAPTPPPSDAPIAKRQADDAPPPAPASPTETPKP